MSFNVKSIPKFEGELKHLAKKYPSLKQEYIQLVHSQDNQSKALLWETIVTK